MLAFIDVTIDAVTEPESTPLFNDRRDCALATRWVGGQRFRMFMQADHIYGCRIS